jgi:hypothetical protein
MAAGVFAPFTADLAIAETVTIASCANATWDASGKTLSCNGVATPPSATLTGCPFASWDASTSTLDCSGLVAPVCTFVSAPPTIYAVGSQLILAANCTTSPTYSWSTTVGALGTGSCASSATCTDTQAGATSVTYHLVATNAVGSATLDAPVTWIVGSAPAPVLQSAASRRVHGAAGTFDIPLSLVATSPTTEPRQGPIHNIVFTFDKPVLSAIAAVTEGAAAAGAPTYSGNSITVPITGAADQQYVTVALTAVASADGGVNGSASVRVGLLLGDVTQNRVVTVADLGQAEAELTQVTTAANFLLDVNASGTISLADTGLINSNLTRFLPAP